MNDKYIKLSEVKKKLNYIFRTYGTSRSMKETINNAISRIPFVVKGELETTLETSETLEVDKIRSEAIKEFAEKLKESLNWRTEPIDDYDIEELVEEMVGEDNAQT